MQWGKKWTNINMNTVGFHVRYSLHWFSATQLTLFIQYITLIEHISYLSFFMHASTIPLLWLYQTSQLFWWQTWLLSYATPTTPVILKIMHKSILQDGIFIFFHKTTYYWRYLQCVMTCKTSFVLSDSLQSWNSASKGDSQPPRPKGW